RPGPRVVAAPGPLDLDDLGAHVAERLRAERASYVLSQIGNDDALEWVRHAPESTIADEPKTGPAPCFRGARPDFDTPPDHRDRIEIPPWLRTPKTWPSAWRRSASGSLRSLRRSPRPPESSRPEPFRPRALSTK